MKKTEEKKLADNVHYIGKSLENEKKKLEEEFVLPENSRLLEEYVNWKVDSVDIGVYQQVKILSKLRLLTNHCKKSFEKFTAEDWKSLLNTLKKRPLEKNTISTYGKTLKGFVRWLHDKNGVKTNANTHWFPDDISWLRPKDSKPEPLDFKKLLHWDDDIETLCTAALNTRDPAFVKTLWDSGVRIGEMLTLRLEDILWEGTDLKFNIKRGKTVELGGKPRKVILTPSVPALKSYLKFHPFVSKKKDSRGFPIIDEDAPIWLEVEGNQHFTETPMDAKSVRNMLERLKTRSGIKKNVNPHWFRKSSASYYAKILSHAEFCYRYGWSLRSDAPSHYITTDEDAMNIKIKRAFNIDVTEELENYKSNVEVRYCSSCKEINEKSRVFCVYCGSQLDSVDEMVAKELDVKLVDLNQQFLSEEIPDFQQKFASYCLKKGFDLNKFKDDLVKDVTKMKR